MAFATTRAATACPLLRLGDAGRGPLALAQAIGRLGCFAAGCCYGVPGQRLAVTFTDPIAAAQTGVPLQHAARPDAAHPDGQRPVLAVLLTWLWRRQTRPPGTTFWLYVLLYSVTRGIIEFWRGDTVRGPYFGGAVFDLPDLRHHRGGACRGPARSICECDASNNLDRGE